MLITESYRLRTLDLDQTELGNDAVQRLFTWLAAHGTASRHPLREYGTTPDFAELGLSDKTHITLRNIYLNAVGIGEAACKAIAEYLMWPGCPIESLYLSNNPLGNAGAINIARGLAVNKSLLRVSLASCGINTDGARAILEALQGHPRLQSLNMSQSNSTKDLETRYNYLGDDVTDAPEIFITSGPQALRLLELGTGMTLPAICSVVENVWRSDSLVVFTLKSVHGQIIPEIKTLVNDHMNRNIQRLYKIDVTTFEAQEKRWLRSPKDVRFINSMYGNRDVGLALRGKKILKKQWDDGLETVKMVMEADDDQ